MRILVIVSGGLDSVTLAHLLASEGHRLSILSFDYGQRHRKELFFAGVCAERLGASYDTVDLSGLGRLLPSSLTTGADVPHGHYAADNMRSTVVPNRNAIMLSVAFGVALGELADAVAFGAHAGDHPIYSDCRPEFMSAFQAMQDRAIAGYGQIKLLAPFVNKTKSEIVAIGHLLNVPFEYTWSCYEGGAVHCGECGTCVERKEAFALSGVIDPTRYLR